MNKAVNLFSKRGAVALKLVLGAILLLGLVAVVYLASQSQNLKKQAAVGEVKATLVPTSSVLPTNVKVYLDPKSSSASPEKLVFAKVVLVFDKTQLKLSADPTISSRFGNIIKKTVSDGVNPKLTKVELIAAVSPNDPAGPLSGAIEFASLPFEANAESVQPVGNNVNFVTAEMQVVSLPGKALTVNAIGTRLFSNRVTNQGKQKIDKDMKLDLTVQNGKLVASWQLGVAGSEGLEYFTIALRSISPDKLISGRDERNVGLPTAPGAKMTATFDTSGIQPGRYYVNLRANFPDKILVQWPRHDFSISPSGQIVLP